MTSFQTEIVDVDGAVKDDIRKCSVCKEDKAIKRIFSLGTEEQRIQFNLYKDGLLKNPGLLICYDCMIEHDPKRNALQV